MVKCWVLKKTWANRPSLYVLKCRDPVGELVDAVTIGLAVASDTGKRNKVTAHQW